MPKTPERAAFGVFPQAGKRGQRKLTANEQLAQLLDERAMELPKFGDLDLEVPTAANRAMGRRMVERDVDLKRQADRDMSPLEKLAGGIQTGRLIGSGLTQAVKSIPTAITKGGKAAEDYIAENIYQPTQPKAYEYAGNIADFLEQLETKYKLPPVLPEAVAIQSLLAPATRQAGKAVKQGAKQGALNLMAPSTLNPQAGIVSTDLARKLSTARSLPQSETFQQAVANTPGASITEEGLQMPLQRGQKVEQELAPSVRGGVFYLPKGAAQGKHYSKDSGAYGGSEKVTGETSIANPLFVKGATGGKSPEQAYIELMGKDAFKSLQDELMGVMSYGNKNVRADVSDFLSKYAPELEDYTDYIVDNSKQGNQLRYALQEAAIGSAARNAGHDAIVGYSKKRTGEPFISEVFDVREVNYPSQNIEPEVFEKFTQPKTEVHISDNPDVMQLELAGGGLVKRLTKGVQNILPALEREANKAKFLEPSKVPQRLYHGTTATEGGKGQEAIKRIKPSKEGALGSGVYLTPNSAHASGYSGIPNDEALAAMAGDPYAKKMADQFMADRASGTLREGQEGGNMLPVHAQLRNPLILEGKGDPMIEALTKLGMDEDSASRMVERAYEQKGYIGKQVQQRAQAAGYDGLLQYRDGDLSEVVSYNPNAVKSAIGNQGTYDINDPDLNKAAGGAVRMAGGGALGKLSAKGAAKGVKEAAVPLSLPRVRPTAKDIFEAAERVGKQQAGEFVKSPLTTKTSNLAGRSKKEVDRLKEMEYKLTPIKDLPVMKPYEAKVGEVNIALPGDQTVSDMLLESVDGIPVGTTSEGGALFGRGRLADPEDKRAFWASNIGPADLFQKKVTELAQKYDTDMVTAYHLAMGQMSNNFAQHMADANLRAIDYSKLNKDKMNAFDRVVSKGYIDPTTKERVTFENWPGIASPEDALLAMKEDPKLRKWFNNRMKTEDVTKKSDLPYGKSIEWAMTEPELRNMEINLTGLSAGRMKPGAELIPDSAHQTYSHDIPGTALGRAPELSPFSISFPDATAFVREKYRPQDFTGTIQKVFPHQVVDEAYLEDMYKYYTQLRKVRGFKKGGPVRKAAGGEITADDLILEERKL